MFQFPRSPPRSLCIQEEVLRDEPQQVAPFGNPRLKLARQQTGAFRSQATPVIGSERLGIHRKPVSLALHPAPHPHTLILIPHASCMLCGSSSCAVLGGPALSRLLVLAHPLALRSLRTALLPAC